MHKLRTNAIGGSERVCQLEKVSGTKITIIIFLSRAK